MYHISCIPISWDNIVNAVQFCSQFLTKFTAYRPYFIMFIFRYLLYMTGLWGEICPVIVDSASSQARRPYHAESNVVKVVVDMNLIHINNDLCDFWQTFISGSHTTFNEVYVDRERTEQLWFYLFRRAMLLYLFTRTRQILLDLFTRTRVLRAAKCVVHFCRLIQTTPALWSCTTGPCRSPMTTPRGVTAYRCWSTTRSMLPAM